MASRGPYLGLKYGFGLEHFISSEEGGLRRLSWALQRGYMTSQLPDLGLKNGFDLIHFIFSEESGSMRYRTFSGR